MEREGLSSKLLQRNSLTKIEEMGFGSFPVCMAKNQYSLSDDAKLLGRPEDFDIHIREVYVSAGAGFVVALTGAVTYHAWFTEITGCLSD